MIQIKQHPVTTLPLWWSSSQYLSSQRRLSSSAVSCPMKRRMNSSCNFESATMKRTWGLRRRPQLSYRRASIQEQCVRHLAFTLFDTHTTRQQCE
jgi:hypothetical protein